MAIELGKDPSFSLIVPVYQVPPDVFKRCLLSIEDQDYKNLEVILVFDGIDQELIRVATPFLSDKRFKIIEIEHAGACAARNAGFKASSGEIVSFFNSDYVAKPGMVRLWVDELLAHPDCVFVYGGYDWAASNASCYPSKPFDAKQLRVANYIDCGFPLWRNHVVEWDVNCKSLQDWDFWLRVVFGDPCRKEPLVKGHFLGLDRTFIAALPRPKGLSHDSSNNWNDRVRYVKEKNGIEMPDVCVASLGAPNHGIKIAEVIGADYRDDTIFKPNEYKALYLIGWYMRPDDAPGTNMHGDIVGHFNKQVKILHFVGADIFWLRKFPHESLKFLSGSINLCFDYVLCENRQAQLELDELGIDADICPIPPYQDYELKPLPETFSVAVFLTGKSDFDKYCYEETLSIVRAMPDVQFTAYGDRGQDLQYPNLKHSGNMDSKAWKEYVYANSCLLRIVRHDTRPMASDEFILSGRDVVTNIAAPYMTVINTGGDLKKLEWDIFQTGLNDTYWPETKKKIVQAIRSLRNYPKSDLERISAKEFFETTLNRSKYIEKIRYMVDHPRLLNIPKPQEEVIHA